MGLFITIEGPEGSGKSTALKIVAKRLEDEGYSLVLTREPGGCEISEQIRNVILNNNNTSMDIITEALLFAAARRQHLVSKVWPSIKEGKIVFCDRYLDSSLAYQGYARNLGVDTVLNINSFATDGTFPDLTLLFDIDVNEGLNRIHANSEREVNRLDKEKISFHENVRKGYLELAKKYPNRIVVIDASKSVEEVANSAYLAIKERLKNN